MAINNYETGHKFGPYELNYDEKSSIEYSKAIKNRDINFPRIRFGIAVGSKLRPSEQYVLKDFKKSEQNLAGEMIVRAADAAELIFEYGLNKAMNKYNA